MIGAELGHAGREPVQHVAIGLDEVAQLGAHFLQLLHVDGIACNADIPER